MESFSKEIYKAIYPDLTFERVQTLRNLILERKELYLDYNFYYENCEELIARSLTHAAAFSRFVQEYDLNASEQEYLSSFYPEMSVVTSIGYFKDSLYFLASNTQLSFYKHLIDTFQIIGSYSQSEIGGGSDLRKIETEAIYDPSKKIFIINSPTITSSKFWIGGLGLSCNYTIIIAKLIINEVDYGPHPFLVQIRNLRSHKPLAGENLGEIGPKIGLTSSDYGFSRYEFLSTPKSSLLDRFWQIDDEGNYKKTFEPMQMLNITHTIARVRTVKTFWVPLAYALTIALKYSYFREQFPSPTDPNKETKIIEYQIQQYKLFPALSRLYCLIFATQHIVGLMEICIEKLKMLDDSLFTEIYCLSSLYKAYVTTRVVEDIEVCRRSCGGHGYMMLSGLAVLYNNSLPACTYAGDNTVITVEMIKNLIMNKPEKIWNMIMMHNYTEGPIKWIYELTKMQLEKLDKKYHELKSRGLRNEEIWREKIQVDACALMEPLFLSVAYPYIKLFIESSPYFKELKILEDIFIACELKRHEANLRLLGISDDEWDFYQLKCLDHFKTLAENSLFYIEAFMIPEEALNSVLTKTNPYEEMLWTSKLLNPINTSKIHKNLGHNFRPKL